MSVKAEVDAAPEAEERAATRRNAQPTTAATDVKMPAAADLAPMATIAQAAAASSSGRGTKGAYQPHCWSVCDCGPQS